jgi:hypothetical protein
MLCTHSHCNIMILLQISPSQHVMIVHTTYTIENPSSSFVFPFLVAKEFTPYRHGSSFLCTHFQVFSVCIHITIAYQLQTCKSKNNLYGRFPYHCLLLREGLGFNTPQWELPRQMSFIHEVNEFYTSIEAIGLCNYWANERQRWYLPSGAE